MKLYQDKAWLKEKYLVEELGCPQIARIVGCADMTILYWLKKHGIPVRSNSAAHIAHDGDRLYKDGEWLRQKYVDEGLSVHQIGTLADSNGDTIWKWLRRHDIPVRTPC